MPENTPESRLTAALGLVNDWLKYAEVKNGALLTINGALIRIFDEFDADYIDVRGDGVFALFNSDRAHTALAATVSFKDFVHREFTPRIKKLTDQSIGGHFGIDRKNVLVRRLGLKLVDDNRHRQNEVWAGKPINMAAKLASRSANGEIWASRRFHLA